MCVLVAGCGAAPEPAASPLPPYADVVRLGGATTDTSVTNSRFAFSAAAPNLSAANLERHLAGSRAFDQVFTPQGGLGPAFNHTSCNACHASDGRGAPPVAGAEFTAFSRDEATLLRLSLDRGGPVPGFGRQLFQRGLAGLRPDSPGVGQAEIFVRYETRTVAYADGVTLELRRPRFEFRNPYDTPPSRLLQADVRSSARQSQPVFGLGLLEAIREGDIVALADPGDADADGISGRPNLAFDPLKARANDPQPVSLGRFGWKAGSANLESQAAGALVDDMGLTNDLFGEENIAGTPLHAAYLRRHPGTDDAKGTDVDRAFLDSVTFYVQSLAVPGRRNAEDARVRAGSGLFEAIGCASCHHPRFLTGTHPAGFDELSGQEIWPFSDLLLHDMGPDLADGRSDFLADGQEWRTRPLWGLGATRIVNPRAGLLHDGRARSVEEAILWHGGEAERARERFRQLSAVDRAALLAFLDSL